MSDTIKETFTLTLQYEMEIDTTTGEILGTKLLKRSVDKANFKVVDATPKGKSSVPESSEPQLILEENKYCLNNAAIELMGLTTDDKLEVKYEKLETGMVPVIGTEKAFGTKGGNKLTKSNTVACRGSKNTELAKYGTVFSITPHATKDGLFVLSSGESASQPEVVDDDDISFPDDLDLSDLVEIDGEDAKSTEISSDFFTL